MGDISTIKVALVTGGSSGIGFAIAKRFTREGYRTIITGRKAEKLDRAVKSLGNGCDGVQFDMADIQGIPAFVEQIRKSYGRIDVLVNNAGINQKKPIFEVSDTDFEHIVRVNEAALFTCSREVARVMSQQGSRGTIIHISSMAAHYGIPKIIAYTASKAAVEGMTKAMAVELSPAGIRINCVAPGFIRTEMSSRALDNDAERKQKVLSRTPMGKLGEPEDIANAVYFLASEEASFITGVTLRVDGGNAIGF